MNGASSGRPVGTRRVLALTVGFAMSAGFLVLLLRRTDLSSVWSELQRVHAGRLSLGLVTVGCGLFLMSVRTRVLVAPLCRLGALDAFRSIMFGLAGNNLLPLRAGELLRIDYLATRGRIAHSSALAVVGVERLLDLLCLALLFFSILPLAVVDLPNVASAALLGAGVLLGLVGLALAQRFTGAIVALARRSLRWAGERASSWIVEKLERLVRGLAALGSLRRTLLALLFTLGYWGCMLSTVRVTIWAFDLALPWYAALVVLVFGALATALPSSPGYVGTYHWAVAFAVSLMGTARESAVSFALILHTVGIVPYTLVALVFVLSETWRNGARPRETTV